MKNNLSLQVAEFSPKLSEESLSGARASICPRCRSAIRRAGAKSASYSWLDTAGAERLHRSQTLFRVDQRTDSDRRDVLHFGRRKQDRHQPDGPDDQPPLPGHSQFSFTQPLLQSFGPKITNYNIVIARNSLDISEISFYKTVQDTVYTVIQAYWSLVYSIENLKVQQLGPPVGQGSPGEEPALGRDRDFGPDGRPERPGRRRLPRSEHPRGRSFGQEQRRPVENADQSLAPKRRRGCGTSSPSTSPSSKSRKWSLDQALMTAMAQTDRPEDHPDRPQKHRYQPQLCQEPAPARPQLQRVLEEPRAFGHADPLRQSADRKRSSARSRAYGSQAWKDAFSFKYSNWSVSLTLSINLSNYLTRAAYAQAKLNMDQALDEHEAPGAAGGPGNPERRPLASRRRYKQVQAYKLARRPGREKYQRRTGKTPGRAEHELYRPPVSAGPDERPGFGARTRSSTTTWPRPASTAPWGCFWKRKTLRLTDTGPQNKRAAAMDSPPNGFDPEGEERSLSGGHGLASGWIVAFA